MRQETLIDTDILSEFFRGNSVVVANIDKYLQDYKCLNISIITYYEVLNGLLYKDARKQLAKFKQFVEFNQVLPLTVKTVDKSAEVQSELRRKGKEISHTDTLIAGIAIVNNLELITNNIEHFKRIPKLKLNNWTR
jgi:predicted nucleic acid-binding protein